MNRLMILLFLLLGNIGFSQTWHSITSDSLVDFDMPNVPGKLDTLNTVFYNYSLDTLLGLEVHIFKNTGIAEESALFTSALESSEGDTLKAMVVLMSVLGNLELVSFEKHNDKVPYIDAGLQYAHAANSEYDSILFIRLYYHRKNFIACTAAGYAFDITRLIATSNQFLSSVSLK